MERGTSLFLFVLFLLLTPIIALAGMSVQQDNITPNDEFFKVSIGDTPNVNSDSYRLEIAGRVHNPTNYSYSDILAMPKIEVKAQLKCVDGQSGVAVWGGVQLSDILDRAALYDSAVEVVFHALDGYSSSLTLEDARKENVLLAWEMNGETMPPDHGFPLKLVAPEKVGYKWVKWIYRVELVDYDYKGYWESRGWSDAGDKALFSDYIVHAALLSVAFVAGGLATVSGLKFSKHAVTWRELPKFVNRRFHIWTSVVYLAFMFIVFVYWCFVTYDTRSDIFYTNHGRMALAAVALHVIGAVTGWRGFGRKGTGRDLHLGANVLGFLLYAGVILTGLIIAF